MVKFGKYLKSHKIEEWNNNYVDYKRLKRIINDTNHNLKNNAIVPDIEAPLKQDNPSISIKEDQVDLPILYTREPNGHLLKHFIEEVEKEFKKVYVFFVSMEKELYRQINSHLYIKTNINNFTPEELYQELEALCLTVYLAKSLKQYINDNMTGIKKILKKFDKKFKDYFGYVSILYLSGKLREQNSDLEYMLQYKVIDETNALVEDLVNNVKKVVEGKQEINNNSHLSKQSFNLKIKEIYDYIFDVDKKNLYQIKYKEWFYYIRSGEKIIKNTSASNVNNDIYNPLLSSPLVNDTLIEKLLSDKARAKLEKLDTKIAKTNKLNLIICVLHAFFFMLSYTIIVPSTFYLLKTFRPLIGTKPFHHMGFIFPLVWAVLPLSTFFSILIFNQFKKHQYRQSMITSFILMIIGNLIYLIRIENNPNHNNTLSQLFPIFLSRIIVGLGTNPLISKKYITQYCSKQNLPIMSLLYLLARTLGFAFGPAIGLLFFIIPDEHRLNKSSVIFHIDRYGYFALFLIFIYVLLLVITFIFFTPPTNEEFKIMDDSLASDFDGFGKSPSISLMKKGGTCPLISTDEKKMLSDIENKLNSFNEKNQFSDTNLIPSNIKQIVENEKKAFSYISNGVFITFLMLLFMRIINEALIVVLADNIDNEFNSSTYKSNFIILSGSLLFESIICFIAARIISQHSHTRKFLLTLLISGFIVSSVLSISVLFWTELYYGIFTVLLVITTLVELVTSNLIANIMPPKWRILGLEYGIFIHTPILLGRVLGSILAMVINIMIVKEWGEDLKDIFSYIISAVVPSFFLILLILIIYNYKNLRVKAISRILRSQYHNKLNQ